MAKHSPPANHLADVLGARRFRCIVADPPWPFNDRGSRVAATHADCGMGYEYMALPDIEALDVASVAADDAMLWLWSTWTHVLEGSAASVARNWGFTPKTVAPWAKLSKGRTSAKYADHPAVRSIFEAGLTIQIGPGHYTRAATEPLILCVRSACRVKPSRHLPALIAAPRSAHSVKPEAAYDFIETMCDGPRLELFARGKPRAGWATWGDQAEAVGG